MYTLDNPTFLLALLILLGLSILTVEYCHSDKVRFRTERQRLFLGDKKIHSFASNLGSLFSVTYFFGATVIYGNILGAWLLLLALTVLLASWAMIRKVLVEHRRRCSEPGQASNVLLDLYRSELSPGAFQTLLGIYILIYFGLLVEELAVARLLLTSLFPSTPALVAIILIVITFCVVLYLYVGGYRGVLRSDLVQLGILAPFLLTLIALMARSSNKRQLIDFGIEIDPQVAALALAFSSFFGVAWFACSIDIFSRFNFRAKSAEALPQERRELLNITFLSLGLLLAIGMTFGTYVTNVLPDIRSPTAYFDAATSYFVHHEHELVAVITLLSLYSMIFTTLDALLLNLLQLGHYRDKRSTWSRGNILRILASAAFLSCLLELNSLGAVGIFFGSLLMLPALVLVKVTFFPGKGRFPEHLRFLEISAIASGFVLVLWFDYFRLPFERQLLIPGVVLCSLLVSLAGAVALSWLRRNFGER